VIDRPDLEIDRLDAAEGALHEGFVATHRGGVVESGGGQAGTDDVEAVEGRLSGDFVGLAGDGEAGVGNIEGEVLGHFVLVEHGADLQADFGFAVQRLAFADHRGGNASEVALGSGEQILALAGTLAGEIAAGGRGIAIQADVADPDAVGRMVLRTEAELGPVSILVNNAGLSSPATLESYDPAAMARMRRVNVDGVIHTIRAVAPGMQRRGYGRIVNIASNAAIGTALPGTTFYAATKAEVLILTRRLAMEMGRRGITVNAVAPGWIVTEMARDGRSEQEFEARIRDMSERTMVGRTGRPEDIANAVAFLSAPESGFMTAQVLTIDGGRMDYIGHG